MSFSHLHPPAPACWNNFEIITCNNALDPCLHPITDPCDYSYNPIIILPLKSRMLPKGLYRHLEIYTNVFEHGFDPPSPPLNNAKIAILVQTGFPRHALEWFVIFFLKIIQYFFFNSLHPHTSSISFGAVSRGEGLT